MLALGERVLITLWVGAMWVVGYVAVPVLFNSLDDTRLAGNLAGELFKWVGVIGIVCGLLLLATVLTRASGQAKPVWKHGRVWLLVAMILLVLADFLMQHMLGLMKIGGLQEGTQKAAEFAFLHGLASGLYLLNSLLGLVLVAVGTGRPLTAPREA